MSDEKTEKAAKAPKVTIKELEERFNTLNSVLTERVEAAEAKLKIIEDSFEFIANETRPLFGFGAIAVIYDAISNKLKGK